VRRAARFSDWCCTDRSSRSVAGLGIGIVAALGLTRLLSGLVYGVSTTDPVTFISLPLLLGVVAFLAGLFPALRASRIDPLEALRVD
jgi:ABC-type antimicrobial peptide transport system permease subunit